MAGLAAGLSSDFSLGLASALGADVESDAAGAADDAGGLDDPAVTGALPALASPAPGEFVELIWLTAAAASGAAATTGVVTGAATGIDGATWAALTLC